MKKQTNTNKPKARAKKHKHYPVHYLALVLSVFLLLELCLILLPTTTDWQEATQLFDMSSGIKQIPTTLEIALAPMMQVAVDVNKFYQLAADEMYFLFSGELFPEFGEALVGISEFYNQASIE